MVFWPLSSRKVETPGRSISRVLSTPEGDGRSSLWAAGLPAALAAYPGPLDGPPLPRRDGPCLALLRVGVAWPAHYCARRWSLTPPFHPYLLRGGMFLWPCPAPYGAPGVTRRPALWSADFPRPRKGAATARPTWVFSSYHTSPRDAPLGYLRGRERAKEPPNPRFG